MQNTVFGVWQNISGSGILTALYVCALIFLFFKEKEKYKRILLVYLPMLWLMLLFFPITYRVIAEVIDEELYYRFFWMLPMTLVIAYAMVQMYHLYWGRYRAWVVVSMIGIIILSGDFVYNNWRYTKAENIFHVPDSVVEMCDLMHVDGREVMAVFPMELLQYVRQYDSTICIPYGRNVLVDDWNIVHPLYDIMEADEIDCDALGKMAAIYSCSYIVCKEEKEKIGALESHGYVLEDVIRGYQIYYNDAVFQSIYN